MDSAGKNQIINAEVPMSEFLTYAPDLRSMTGGRGIFTMEFARYDEVPGQIAEKLLAEFKKQQEE
jgi:elongation factor G